MQSQLPIVSLWKPKLSLSLSKAEQLCNSPPIIRQEQPAAREQETMQSCIFAARSSILQGTVLGTVDTAHAKVTQNPHMLGENGKGD